MPNRGVIKGYLKSDEQVKKLAQKAIRKIEERHLEEADLQDRPCPRLMTDFVNSMNVKIGEVNNKANAGEPLLKQWMDTLPDDKIQALKDIYKESSGVYSEDRIYRSCYVLFEQMNEIEAGIQHLNHTKSELVKCFTRCFTNEFSKKASGGGDLTFDNLAFRECLKNVESYRRGLRHSVERGSNSESNDDSDASGRCSVM